MKPVDVLRDLMSPDQRAAADAAAQRDDTESFLRYYLAAVEWGATSHPDPEVRETCRSWLKPAALDKLDAQP